MYVCMYTHIIFIYIHTIGSPSLHHIYPSYIQTYMHTYIHTYIQYWFSRSYTMVKPSYIHTYIHTYMHTYIQYWFSRSFTMVKPSYIHTYIHTHSIGSRGPTQWSSPHTYTHTYIHTYSISSRDPSQWSSPHTYIHTYTHTYIQYWFSRSYTMVKPPDLTGVCAWLRHIYIRIKVSPMSKYGR